MNPEMISGVLDKLKQKTGREWTLADLLTLAEKLPKLQEKGTNAIFDELAAMGLTLSEETKSKVASQLQGRTVASLRKEAEALGGSKSVKKATPASKKKEDPKARKSKDVLWTHGLQRVPKKGKK